MSMSIRPSQASVDMYGWLRTGNVALYTVRTELAGSAGPEWRT